MYGCAAVWRNVHVGAIVCGGQKKSLDPLELE